MWLHAIRMKKKNISIYLRILTHVNLYSLRFKIKVMFGHKLRYEIKVSFGEISLKLHQTSWNVAIINVNVVVDELYSQNNSLHLFNN
jgi:hypothetical protein